MIDLSQKQQTTTEVSLYVAKAAHFILQEKFEVHAGSGTRVDEINVAHNVFVHVHVQAHQRTNRALH